MLSITSIFCFICKVYILDDEQWNFYALANNTARFDDREETYLLFFEMHNK